MFHKEGSKIILIAFLLTTAIMSAIWLVSMPQWLQIALSVFTIGFLFIILQFFRNPKRNTELNDKTIVSPVDGKVVVIEKVTDNEYFKGERLMISVFMSPINVHVTRYPISGQVAYSKYHPGKYLVAWHPKASEENERTTVVINHKNQIQVMYRQIAGALAKRIVNYAQENEQIVQGSDSGFIKFGSRVDVYLPIDTPVTVKLNEKVKGGETVLATF
ncbi:MULTISPECIES: phosphatidylserine decarboxylase family protein [Nonlabens]|uniref:Phosphatidylserine decarboxylase n=1 Tax=Nonlabens xylanidelens TaxID=191564 RepID=A0A2S6IJK9_9FLAO|nr:phosphatidylserine decarboxylase family protein [Nonlabens xylanidelens]PPK94366.1 phosphatidylserine decarboxylase [Nonlabens xylanidelens]PQJ18709.1 phosphatidylserine decarboxylase [Nonlabens xylanidelens]PQJ18898.1 phosphatidylserine decarboxylase [Nonlabens xylanidelens]PQJ21471.1 phosphatidylserine decarboxylase [Nonlabens xylanidelens]